MHRTQILVISPDPFVAAFLTEHLAADRFDVQTVPPGAKSTAMSHSAPLHVAVVDQIEHRSGAAQREVALLKAMHPKVRIIAISRRSSDQDASVVEQGVFYYWTGQLRPEFVRLIEAAAPSTRLDEIGGSGFLEHQ